jgi:hypothetical protein
MKSKKQEFKEKKLKLIKIAIKAIDNISPERYGCLSVEDYGFIHNILIKSKESLQKKNLTEEKND